MGTWNIWESDSINRRFYCSFAGEKKDVLVAIVTPEIATSSEKTLAANGKC